MKSNIEISTVRHTVGDAAFAMCRIHVSEYEHNGVLTVHHHSAYELHFAKKDFSFQMIEDSVPMRRGCFLIIPPETMHYGLSDAEDADAFLIYLQKTDGKIGFYDCFKKLLDQNGGKELLVSPKLRESAEALSGVQTADNIKQHTKATALFASFIYELFEALQIDDKKQYAEVEDNHLLILETLMYDADITVQDIAKWLGYSVRHTSRLITATYGMTFTEFRKKRAISAAKRLMATESMSLWQIATLSGFSSVTAMQKALKGEKKNENP